MIVATVLLAGTTSHALTLGRIQGAPLIGRPLDVVVQVQLDTDQTPATTCFDADVFYADTRLDGSRVQLRAEPTAAPQTVNLRITSATTIDEPVVSVFLRAGCVQKTSRRYVMLADVVSEQAAPFMPRVGAVPLVTPPSAQAAGTRAAAGGSVASQSGTGTAASRAGDSRPATAQQGARRPASPAAAQRTRRAAAANNAPPRRSEAAAVRQPQRQSPAPARTSAPRQAPAQSAVGRPRLQLDPLESLSERVAVLESSSAPGAPAPTPDAAAREARDAQRLDTLEANMRQLVELATKNEARMLEMQARLQRIEADRLHNPLVYVLGLLLLLALALIVFLFTRMRRDVTAQQQGTNWWNPSPHGAAVAGAAAGSRADDAAASRFAPESRPPSAPAPSSGYGQHAAAPAGAAMDNSRTQQIMRPAVATAAPGAAHAEVDVSLVELSASTFDRLMQTGTAHSALRKAQDSGSTAPSAQHTEAPATTGDVATVVMGHTGINSDDLFDIRQQAEFFVSLGQTDQAVQVLENRIAEHGESSPQAYLDLLKLFHSLGLKADYRQVREDFLLLFNCSVPEFAQFGDEGKDLEHYPALMDKVIAAWGKPAVLETIENLLLRGQWRPEQAAPDLAAFRDLLLLHAVAQQVAASATRRGGLPPLPDIDSGPGVDIDLSDLIAPTPVSAPAAEAAATAPVKPTPATEPFGNLIDFDLTEGPDDTPARSPKH